MKKLPIIVLGIFLALVCYVDSSHAYEVSLPGVQWISQLDTANGMGTDWTSTMNCGPTSLVMTASYLRSFTPTTQIVKDLDDWLYENELIPAINNYNLTHPNGTSQGDLRAASAYYFGLWNTEYHNTSVLSSDAQLDLMHNSLNQGYPVIIGVRTNMSITGALHWMVAIGLRDNDNDGDYDDVYVNDPGKSPTNSLRRTWYPISQFKNVFTGAVYFYNNNQAGEYNDPYGWHNEEYYANGSTSKMPAEPSQPFVDYYLNNGTETLKGPDFFGYPTDTVHQYYYSGLWVQNYSNGYLFILNQHIYNITRNYMGVALSVHGHMRDYWQWYYMNLKAPVTNEYFYPEGTTDYVVQWFEPTDNHYIAVVYDNREEVGGTFAQYEQNDAGCPLYEQRYFDQARELNCGYKSDGYGMGGGGPMITDPANLTASALSDTSISLVMSLPENAGDYDQTVVIRDGNILSTHNTVSNNLIVSGLSAGENYCFRVRLQNSSSGLQSEVSNEACATTDSSPPPPPPPDYTVEEAVMCENVEASAPYNYIDPNYTYAKSPGVYAYTWMRVFSTNPNLSFEWKLYYHPDNLRIWDASKSANQPVYLVGSGSYYNSTAQEYIVWHYPDSTNSLPSYFGQYRVELWINGVKAKIIYFNLILETPLKPGLSNNPTAEEVNLVCFLVPGGAIHELYRDDDYIGDFNGVYFTDTNVVPGATHEYRVMAVSADGFRSQPSEAREVVIPSDVEPPVLGADFIADVVSGETSLTVNFIDLSVGEFDSWDWDFGDRYRSTEPNPTHIFVRSGTYTVSLTVSGPDGTYTVTKEDYITVSYITRPPRPPRLR